MSRKRSAIASGGASACERLPRRRGSDSSSVVPSLTATNTSWSGAALARVRVDVAGGDGRDAEPLGELGEQAVAAAVAAAVGALQLDAQAVAAEGCRRRSPAALASACLFCSIRFASTPSRAQPVRQTRPSVWSCDRVERKAG